MNIYPLLMAPHFRHGAETPWGGNILRDIFMKDAPGDNTGESYEVSAVEGQESMVANGEHAGKALSRMVELWGEALTGRDDGKFPLLLKLIDAQQSLSLQVHPDDAYAMAHEGKLGKSEAWVILYAEPGATIVTGLDTHGEDLRAVVEADRLGDCLVRQVVQPGDVYYIPSNTAHALGAGIQCYNIQQSSDASYRLWDWDRVDKDGNRRELQVDKSIESCDVNRTLSKNEGTTVLCKGGSRTYYISDTRFELCRLNLSGKMPLEPGRMMFLTPLSECTLRWKDGEMTLKPFDSVLVPAGIEEAMLVGNTKVMMSSLPQREKLIEELGYRAENVAGLVD